VELLENISPLNEHFIVKVGVGWQSEKDKTMHGRPLNIIDDCEPIEFKKKKSRTKKKENQQTL